MDKFLNNFYGSFHKIKFMVKVFEGIKINHNDFLDNHPGYGLRIIDDELNNYCII